MLATGLIFGIQTMNRPNIAIAVVGLVVTMLALRRWRPAVILSAGLLLGLSPAVARNIVVSHQFSLLSSHGGLNFYIGNHEGADGYYQVLPGITPSIKGQQEDTRRVAERALGHAVTDAQASDYFMDLSLMWMAAHPGDALFLMVRKFGLVFHAQHIALPYSYPFYQYDVPTWLRFYVIGPWLLVPLDLIGLVFCAPRLGRTDFLVWAAFVPCYAAAVALFFMSERYRLPLLVPLVIGAGGALDALIQHITSQQLRAIVVPVAVGVVGGDVLGACTSRTGKLLASANIDDLGNASPVLCGEFLKRSNLRHIGRIVQRRCQGSRVQPTCDGGLPLVIEFAQHHVRHKAS